MSNPIGFMDSFLTAHKYISAEGASTEAGKKAAEAMKNVFGHFGVSPRAPEATNTQVKTAFRAAHDGALAGAPTANGPSTPALGS